jgi:hypothetical protein
MAVEFHLGKATQVVGVGLGHTCPLDESQSTMPGVVEAELQHRLDNLSTQPVGNSGRDLIDSRPIESRADERVE